MRLLESLDAADSRLFRALRIPAVTGRVRQHPVAALGVLVVFWYGPFAARAASEAAWVGSLSPVFFLLGLVGVVLAAIAVVDDMNQRGVSGWLWGLLVLFTNVIGISAWIIRRRSLSPAAEARNALPRQGSTDLG